MALNVGTRKVNNFHKEHPDQGSETRAFTRDLGILKNVTASMTFTASNGRATAAGGTFANFAVGGPVEVQNVNKNNGYFTVVATDASTYIQLDNPVKDEGPISANIRTS